MRSEPRQPRGLRGTIEPILAHVPHPQDRTPCDDVKTSASSLRPATRSFIGSTRNAGTRRAVRRITGSAPFRTRTTGPRTRCCRKTAMPPTSVSSETMVEPTLQPAPTTEHHGDEGRRRRRRDRQLHPRPTVFRRPHRWPGPVHVLCPGEGRQSEHKEPHGWRSTVSCSSPRSPAGHNARPRADSRNWLVGNSFLWESGSGMHMISGIVL